MSQLDSRVGASWEIRLNIWMNLVRTTQLQWHRIHALIDEQRGSGARP